MSELTVPAQVAADCLGIAAGEKVAVLHNGPQAAIAQALHDACVLRGAEARVLGFPPLSRSGVEPPAEVVRLMGWADAAFGVTTWSLSHCRARVQGCRDGLRFASMPSLTEDIFRRTLPVDYPWMSAAGATLASLLTEADECRLTSPEGTDVRLSLTGRDGRNDDGDLRAPGAFGNLPAGEGYIAPVETAGEGTIVFDGAVTGVGVLAEPLVITLREGSLVEASGPDAPTLRQALRPAGPSGRRVAELGIGTNPAARITGVVLEDEKVLGTAHIAFGTSTGLGGTNQSTIHIDGIMRRPSIWVGDTCVLADGRLRVGPEVEA